MVRDSLTPDTPIVRSQDVLCREIEGEVVLLEPEEGRYFALNQSGTVLWHLLRQPTTLGRIQEQVLEQYRVTPEQLWDDIVSLVSDLADHGLVCFEPGPTTG